MDAPFGQDRAGQAVILQLFQQVIRLAKIAGGLIIKGCADTGGVTGGKRVEKGRLPVLRGDGHGDFVRQR
ncbi:hypothetical protein AA16373_2113 [Komagataeibacter swingsii DSM 16373]|nr:hypothetical protein AA16373_2113 [Komagataeibacter swingsii DSM 16373]